MSSRPEYERVAQELYVAYFGRPAGPAVIQALRLEVVRLSPAEMMREISGVDVSPRNAGPTAQQARRAQIKRNGGKR